MNFQYDHSKPHIWPGSFVLFFSGEELPTSTLRVVQIFFDTATFDNIEKDRKVKVEGQVSLIGGTMGLLTGFSIISGVEIVYFAAKAFAKIVARQAKSVKN